MIDKLKRRWFQIHLSTCIVLMFVAGGLVWANVAQRTFRSNMSVDGWTVNPPYQITEAGWPIEFKTNWPSFAIELKSDSKWTWSFGNLALNIATALAVLAATAFACEWLIRRGKADKL